MAAAAVAALALGCGDDGGAAAPDGGMGMGDAGALMDAGAVDAGPRPPAPTLSGTEPVSPSSVREVVVVGTAAAPGVVAVFGGADCGGGELGRDEVALDGAFRVTVTVPADAETLLSARALRGELASDCTPNALVYLHDGVAPEAPTWAGSDPPSPATTTRVTLNGMAEPGAEVALHLADDCGDGAVATAPAGPATGGFAFETGVEAGALTTFYARATDAAGNASACSAPLPFESLAAGNLPQPRFPPGRSLTDAASITVRGGVPDPSGVTGVTVGAVAATSDDGFATWAATVPLALGDNRLDIDVTRTGGAVLEDVAGLDVRREATILGEIGRIAYDAPRDRVLMVEPLGNRLVAVDVATGEASVVSSGDVGTGDPFMGPRDVAVDAANDRAFVTTRGRVIFEVDLRTGDRTVVSSTAVGDGVLGLDRPEGIAYDAERDRVIVTDQGTETVLAIDVDSGDRFELTGGFGVLSSPEGVAVDGDVAYVADSREDTIVEVDLVDGSRTILSGDSSAGLDLFNALDVAVVGSGDDTTILVADSVRNALFEVDPDTGDRSRPRSDVLPGLGGALGVAAGGTSDQVFAACGVPGWIVEVDRSATPARTPLPTPGLPATPSVGEAADVVADLAGGRFFVADQLGARVVEVTLASGARRVVAAAAEDTFDVPQGLAFDAAGAQVFVSGTDRDVVAVDLVADTASELGALGGSVSGAHLGIDWDADGDRVLFPNRGPAEIVAFDGDTGATTTVSGDAVGDGPAFRAPSGVALDAAGDRLFVVDQLDDRVVAVDLDTGDRTVLSGDGAGSGPNLLAVSGGAWDPVAEALYLNTGSSTDAIVAVDPTTGARTLVSDPDRGAGPVLGDSTGLDVLGDGVLLVSDRFRGGVYAVHVGSGDRVILAR